MTEQDFIELITAINFKGELGKYIPTSSGAQFENFRDWVGEVWFSNQGSLLQVPATIPISKAAEMVSIICEYKARKQGGGTVEIKKVAEIRGSRFNTGKLRMDLLDPIAMEGLSAVLTKGAIKYNAHNWRQGLPYMEIIASLLRHTMAVARGEDIDPETGEYHADHMQCNTMFLSNMMKTRPDMDDRWKSVTDKQPLAGDTDQATTFGPLSKSS